jgi:hypothetical protein
MLQCLVPKGGNIMNKKQSAFNAIESAFFVAQVACFPDIVDEEIFFHDLPIKVQTELIKAQKNICADFGVTPTEISMVDDDSLFIYSLKPFHGQP